jgi:hypothetical protein
MLILYLSGYADDAAVSHGILHERVNYLQKPSSTAALLRKVREVLATPTSGGVAAGSGNSADPTGRSALRPSPSGNHRPVCRVQGGEAE